MSTEDYKDFKEKNKGKKIVIIYGNCHTTAIRQALNSCSEFRKHYAIFPIRAIQEVKDPAYFKGEAFFDCDIFLHQSIQKANRYGEEFSSVRVMAGLKDNAEIIAIPNVYHLPMCYFPQYYEGKELKSIHGDTMFFRDRIIDEGIRTGKTVDVIARDYRNSGRYMFDNIRLEYDKYMNRIKMREQEWDIKMSDFLSKNRDKFLFYDPNHPTNIIIEYICQGIMNRLDIVDYSFDFSLIKQLDNYEMPMCRDVIDYFNMDYNQNNPIRSSGNKVLRGKMRLEDYIKQYVSLLWQDDSFGDKERRLFWIKHQIYRSVNIIRKIGGVQYND